jgi:crotonobetainyl-CoA:carnitine CoA-transferase CaiB-like acyl-CoA transferase
MRSALKNRHALRALIASGLAAMTVDEADAALKAHDVTFSVVARIADVVDDPQLIANGLVVGTDASVPGYERTLATPFKLHDEAQRKPARAPTIGEHSRDVLEQMGLTGAQIDALIEQGIVGVG